MLIAIIPVVVLILGALVYGLSANPKVQEMGRLAFGCGLLVALFGAARAVLRLPVVLLFALAMAACGEVPATDVTTTESAVIYYSPGTICPEPPVWWAGQCSRGGRIAYCITSSGEQVIGCKFPIRGYVSYFLTCVNSCPNPI